MTFLNEEASLIWIITWPIITASIFGFIYLPIGLYHLHKYYKNRNHIVLIKRYSIITIYESIFVCIRLLWGIIYVLFVLWLFVYGVAESDFVNSILSTFDEFLTITLSYLWCWRFYMLSYDTHFVVSSLNNQWKSIINPQFIKSRASKWYINKRDSFGDPMWIKTHIGYLLITINTLFACIPLFIISIFYRKYQGNNYFIITALYVQIIELIPFLLLVIIFIITPKFEDNFFIRFELRLLFIILLIDALCNTGLDSYVLFSRFSFNSWWYSIILCIQFNLYWLTQFTAMMISTYIINNKVSDIIKESRFSVLRSNGSYIELLPMVQVKTNKISIINRISLKQILTHPKAFELYTFNLILEFSIECILCFVELTQFQQFIYQYIESNNIDNNYIHSQFDERIWFKTHKLPPNVPKSLIVWFDDNGKEKDYMAMNERDFKYTAQYKAYLLHNKYIDYGSLYEVNISHLVRNKIRKLWHNKDINGKWIYNDNISFMDLLYLFNDVCGQLYSLLNSSFDRFQQTTEYDKLTNFVFI